ncbi:MAG: methionyl-tRNA formyltransferase, partial [Candidatus Paceibacterota bacterium]
MSKSTQHINSVFFGTDDFSVAILEKLEEVGIIPTLVVTPQDKPSGRGNVLTPPLVKVWAEERGVDVLQPETLAEEELDVLFNSEWDLFLVASYGKIIPQTVLDLPKHGTLNVHPSLLPKLRGPRPIEEAILNDIQETGVTIMLVDNEVDHGPIISQARVTPEEWPLPARALRALLAEVGGELLAETIPAWLEGEITPEEQNHEEATFTRKLKKE